MDSLDIRSLCGHSWVTREDGAKLRSAIEPYLTRQEAVVVDFGDLQIASVSFLDEGLALLARQHSTAQLKKLLVLHRMRDADRRLLNQLLASRAREASTSKDSDQPES